MTLPNYSTMFRGKHCKPFFLVLAMLSLTISGFSQTISGTVTDAETGESLIGVSVIEANTSNGTSTDIDGTYSIELSSNENSLEFSYVGYATQTVQYSGDGSLNIQLNAGTELSEVVVTALGISRESKGLTYAVDQVDGKEMNTVKDANVINALSGKTPGLEVKRSSSGVGGSTRVILRGNSSTSNNDPLYVVDGIPMTNNRYGQQGGVFGGSVDSGDGISNINPDDIASISVLKGASAAALYGSQAANGVILITTKRGEAGAAKVTISSTLTSESAAFIPEQQFRYGQSSPGAEFSWGGAVTAPDHVDGFFQNGTNFINSVSISGGTEKAQTYFSYANTDATGIIPGNKLRRHNINLNQVFNFFDDKLKITGNVNFISQDVANRPGAGLYFNPLTGLYFFPRGLDFNEYENNYEVYSETRNINLQNWVADRDIQQNPFWILNRNQNENTRDRLISSISANYKLTPELSLKVRGNIDKSSDSYTHNIFASTQGTLADNNGRYILQNNDDTQLYGDVLLNYSKQVSDDVALDIYVGGSHTNRNTYNITADSKNGDLAFANKFGLQYLANPIASNLREGVTRTKRNAVFTSAQFGYQSKLYVDVTARNDWSSTLPNTSFFYPSFGATAILSEMMDLPVGFAKLRASYAIVGNDVPAYLSNPKENRGNIVNGQLQFSTIGALPGTELVPEESTSFELGLDLRSKNNKLGFDITYYKTNTKNQFINISAPAGSGFTRYLVNAGNVQNSGLEARISYDVISQPKLNWETSINLTQNNNEIIALHPEFDSNPDAAFFITNESVNSYGMVVQKGGSFGDLWAERFLRDAQGRIVVDDDLKPQKGGLGFVGNPNPDFSVGWNNQVSIGDFTLRMLIDAQFGGEVISITEALLDEYGVSERTAAARDAGGVTINAVKADGTSVTSIPADVYYGAVGGRQGISEAYVFDATNIRMRELAISYRLPDTILKGKARVSLVGRNLFFFSKKAPYDPDVTASTGVGLQGVDIFSLPSTRSFGFNLTFDL